MYQCSDTQIPHADAGGDYMTHIESEKKSRQEWISVLSTADWSELETLWDNSGLDDHFSVLRGPETGLVMVRGRTGGAGQPFNAGEATVTRCSIKNGNGIMGHAYVLGRNGKHAEVAARLDAALQENTTRESLISSVIEPLKQIRRQKLEEQRAKTAATKVDFFTMVRGED